MLLITIGSRVYDLEYLLLINCTVPVRYTVYDVNVIIMANLLLACKTEPSKHDHIFNSRKDNNIFFAAVNLTKHARNQCFSNPIVAWVCLWIDFGLVKVYSALKILDFLK